MKVSSNPWLFPPKGKSMACCLLLGLWGWDCDHSHAQATCPQTGARFWKEHS